MPSLDSLIKESVCSESIPSSSSSENITKFGSKNVDNIFKTKSSLSILNGAKSILNSSLDFEKVSPDSSQHNYLYNDLENNPKIIKVSKNNSDMFKTLSYFHRNTASLKEKDTGTKSDDDGIPAPKMVLFKEKIQCEWQSSGRMAGAGLHNQGNTCFLNSVLQCLAYTPPLYNVLIEDNHSNKCKVTSLNCMLCEIQRTTKRMFDHPQSAISPMTIVNRIREIGKCFHPGRQEDAHEFLVHLFDSMQKACLFGKPKLDNYTQATTLLHKIFGGFCRSQVTCLKCHNKSNTYDPFLTLSIDLQHCNNIKESLARFTKKEFLGNDNMYKCDKCRHKVDATRRVTFQRLPNVFIFHLKRFNYNGLNMKLSKHLQFPEKLDLNSFVSEDVSKKCISEYNLYGVLVHSGFSTHSGHYYCFAKAPNGVWHKFNDSIVSKCSITVAMQAEAYLLFYVRKQPPPTSQNAASLPTKICHTTPKLASPLVNGESNNVQLKSKTLFDQPNLTGFDLFAKRATSTEFGKTSTNVQNKYIKSPSLEIERNSNLVPTSSMESSAAADSNDKRTFSNHKIPKLNPETSKADDSKDKTVGKTTKAVLSNGNIASTFTNKFRKNDTSTSSSKTTTGYDRLHPFECANSGSSVEKDDSATKNNGNLVPYSYGESDSDSSDDDDNKGDSGYSGSSDGPPNAKKPKVIESSNSSTNGENCSSTISSNLSLFTSSGSNSKAVSETNVCDVNNSTNNLFSSCHHIESNVSTDSVIEHQCSGEVDRNNEASKTWPLKSHQSSKYSSAVNPDVNSNTGKISSKEYSFTSSHSNSDVFDEENVLEPANSAKLSDIATVEAEKHAKSSVIQKESPSLQGPGSLSGNYISSNARVNERMRSPSVSSTDSRTSSSSVSAKKTQMQKFKDQLRSVKLQMGKSHVLRKQPGTLSPSTHCSSIKQSGNSKSAQYESDVIRSPHVDHNYVQNRETKKPHLNSQKLIRSEITYNNVTTGPGPYSWNRNQSLKPNSTTVHVDNRNNYFNVKSSVSCNEASSSARVDILDQLQRQNITKSWNGDHYNHSSHYYQNRGGSFSSGDYYNNENVRNNNRRKYDEFDAQIDQGHTRKRKNNSMHENIITNGGGYRTPPYSHERNFNCGKNSNPFQSVYESKRGGFSNSNNNSNYYKGGGNNSRNSYSFRPSY